MARPYPFKLFKGCLPQNLLTPLLNTLSHLLGYRLTIDSSQQMDSIKQFRKRRLDLRGTFKK